MKKKLLTLFLAVATCGMMASAATKYEINVAGVEVTSDNCNVITGGGITGGYAAYNASTNTLTCYNLKIYRTGQDNYGIHNRKCDNLKIVFSGSCDVRCGDNALKLERGTTIEALSGSNTTLYSSARIVMNLKSYNYYIQGSGNLNVVSSQDGYEAIKGEGLGSTNVYFDGAKVTASSSNRPALRSFTAYMRTGADLTIKANDEYYSVYDVYFSLAGRVAILEPYGAYVNSNSIYNSSGNQIASEDIYISDDYVALLKVNYFPDTKFIGALLSLYPKGYITANDVANCTSLSVSSKSISSLEGIHYFTELTSLDCSYNNLTSINVSSLTKLQRLNCNYNYITTISGSLPSSLTKLECFANNLSSLPNLPSGLQYLDCGQNKFTSLYISDKKSLKTLNLRYNSMLTSLSVSGCSALRELRIQKCKIMGTSMTALINSLPTIPASETAGFLALFEPSTSSNADNEFTNAHNLAVRAKHWLPMQYKNNTWVEIPLPGDVNGDGKINVTDVTTLVNMILKVIPQNLTAGDINGDGRINVTDVTALVNIILGQG